MYINQPLKKYLDDLSDKKPTPGGGSVSALVSSLGTALISMVCNFTIGKPKYKEVAEEVKKLMEENEILRLRLMELIDLDVSAYGKISNLTKLIKESDKNKKEIEEELEKATKEAIAIPLEICHLSLQALKICMHLVDKSNINLISDLFISAILLKSGFQSSLANIEINLTYLKDKDYIVEIKKIIEPLVKENEILPNLIQERIKEKLSSIK